ncbi:MAG: pilus assembly protein [Actinomycetales bacterium]|nr:pilus assembly protein [Actinomycetales bacterium]
MLSGESRDRGAVAVEFALIFPVFLFMILFMLDAGRYLTVQMALNNAAEVGARSVAESTDATVSTTQVLQSLPDSIVRLSTMDAGAGVTSVSTSQFVCPINSENFYAIDPNTGIYGPNPDGNCTDLGTASGTSCSTVLANYRAMARVYVSFKWITPIGLIINLANPQDVGPGNSIYFDRNADDTTIIEGKAKLLCLN